LLIFAIDLETFEANAGGIVFPNPNAPTARDIPSQQIEALLQRHTDHVLLVDEAYADLGAESVVSLIKRFPNLLVSHTFSKGRSLAGMRLGAAFGSPELIDGLQRVKNSFNSYPVDALAQAAGIASIKDESYYRSTLASIISTRQWTIDQLSQRGFESLPSSANFVFTRVPSHVSGGAEGLFKKLSDSGVLVRYWAKPRHEQWLRISIGTPEEMQKLMVSIDA